MRTIITKKGKLPGKTIAIFAGIHGNEPVGVEILRLLISQLQIQRGTVHFVFGNPRAIVKGVRFTESNLNRNFIPEQKFQTYEQKRAKVLMKLLDTCDALLDLHAYRSNAREALPFAICEPRCHSIINKFPVPISISGISSFQPGSTNGYMESKGRIGIVLELGNLTRPKDYVDVGTLCVKSFLSHFGCIKKDAYLQQTPAVFLRVCGVYRKSTARFKFTKKYNTFDTIAANEIIATDDGICITAKESGYIMFPSATDAVGTEAFWLLSKTDQI